MTEIDPITLRRRERWRRNQHDARARKRDPVTLLEEGAIRAILAERDRRASTECAKAILHDSGFPDYRRWTVWRRLPFIADVWAAQIILTAQFGRATATKVAEWVWTNSNGHGYKRSSLRPMIYEARKYLAELDAAAPFQWNGESYWISPFVVYPKESAHLPPSP